VLGYRVTGSTGTLFLYGVVVGAVGLAGPSLLLAGAPHLPPRPRGPPPAATVRRQTAAVSADQDDLLGQRDTARAYTASTLGSDTANGGSDARPSGSLGRRRLLPAPIRRAPRAPHPRVTDCLTVHPGARKPWPAAARSGSGCTR